MTTLSTHQPAAGPRLAALTRSEALRARSRRSLFWLCLLSIVAILGIAAITWFTTAHVTGAQLDTAMADFRAEQQLYYEQCMADVGETGGDCWQPTEADVVANAAWYLPHQPFGQDSLNGLVSFAGGIGLLVALLFAATTGGADWGARTMGLLLSWEPRRTRVFLVRIALAVLIAVAVELALVALAAGIGWGIGGAHGIDPDVATRLADTYRAPDLAATTELVLRWLPLTALAAAGSFGVAMLTRSTGWAIGASIGFVAVVETVLQLAWPWASQWLVQTNMLAWLQGGRLQMVSRQPVVYDDAAIAPGVIMITDTRALLTLSVIAALAVLAGWIALVRRDVE